MQSVKSGKKRKCSQTTIILLCALVYTVAYCGRYSYNSSINLIMADFGVSHADAGLVTTCFFFAYGVGQVLNGFLNKYYNKRLIFTIVLTVSSIFNILLYIGIPFAFIKYMWFLNGLLQSCLWPTIISILSENLDDKHMTKAMVYLSITTSAGTALIYGFSTLCVWLDRYRMTFLFAAFVMLACALAWLFIFEPTNMGVKPIDAKEENAPKGKFKGLVLLLVTLGIFAVVHNFVKDGLSTWVPAILKEQCGMPDSMSLLLTIALPLLGMAGAVLAIKVDKFIPSFVTNITVLFTVSIIFMCIVNFVPGINPIVLVLCFAVILCMMHGINTVIESVAPLKMREHVDSGKMAGVLNGFCYVGSTLSSYGMGAIADRGGWTACYKVILIALVVMIAVGVFNVVVRRIAEKKEK